MAEIKINDFAGGAGIQEGHGSSGLATALRDVADDLAALNAAGNRPANIVSADAVPSVAAPTKAEFDAVVTLVNEIKASINAVVSPTIATTKG